jgi:hypothetical protein
LYCRRNSARLRPWGPRSFPTGGAGVGIPASNSSFTFAIAFFLFPAIPYLLSSWIHNRGRAPTFGAASLPCAEVPPTTAQTEPGRVLPSPKGAWMGRTSDLHAGQWNTPSGSLRISGCPHSQGWAPRASGRPVISRRVSSVEPTSGIPHEPQRAKSCPKEASSPDSQNGQMMWDGMDAVLDGTLIAVSFAGCQPVAGMPLRDPPGQSPSGVSRER